MQEHVLRQTSIVGIKVIVVPLVAAIQYPIAVLPIIVATHGYHVLSFFYIRCQVKSKSHHAIIREAHLLSIQPHIGTLTGTLELNEHFSLYFALGQDKGLTIPADSIGQVNNILAKGLIAIKGVRQRYLLPQAVVIIWFGGLSEIAYCQSPATVEIEFLSLCSIHTHNEHQQYIE